MSVVETVKVMPTSKDQGEFLIINKANFDEKVHKLYKPKGDTAKETK